MVKDQIVKNLSFAHKYMYIVLIQECSLKTRIQPLHYGLFTIGKFPLNSRIKPQMYVSRSTLYEKAPFY